MKNLLRTMLFVSLMFLMITPIVFAQSDTELVRFNGIYQSIDNTIKFTYDSPGDDNEARGISFFSGNKYTYFRFFPDKTIALYSTKREELALDVYKKMEKYPSSKHIIYEVSDGKIEFTISYPNGTVDYVGTMKEGKLHVEIHSNITKKDYSIPDCSFIEY